MGEVERTPSSVEICSGSAVNPSHRDPPSSDTLQDRIRQLEIRAERFEALQAELRASEAKYRTIFENAMLGIFVSTPDGRILSANPALARILGYDSPEQLIATVTDVKRQLYTIPELRDDLVRRLAEHGFVRSFETQFWRRDRSTVWVQADLTAIRDRDGTITHYEGIVSDITERTRATESLKDSEERFRQLAEHIGEVLYITDPGLSLMHYISPAYEEVWGRSCESLYASPRSWMEAVHADDQAQIQHLARDIAETETSLDFRIERPDGEVRWIAARFYPVRDAAGDVRRIVGVARDITLRILALESLQESEGRFRQLVEHIEEVFYITDPALTEMVYISPAYERIWGRACASLYESPRSWADAIHPEDRERMYHAIESHRTKGTYDEDYRIVRPDGGIRWIHDRNFVVTEPDGEVNRIVGVAEDITQAKHLQQQLFQAQKMEAIGTLAGGVAHDFNNVLTAMMGYAQLALMEEGLSSTIRDHLSQIPQQGHRAAQLISQLLTFSRRSVVNLQPLQLIHLVKETGRMLERTLRENVVVRVETADNVALVKVDATQIQQVLMNLCVNAGQAMQDGGLLVVKLENTTLDEAYCRQYVGLDPGDYVCLTVEDTGLGMSQEVQQHLFEPFFTTKAPGEGTGLGLATAYGIVREHGGHIHVYSDPGCGSVFRVYLPSLDESDEMLLEPQSAAPPGGAETILMVEDDEKVLIVGEKMLRRLGYTVFTVKTAAAALDVYRERGPEIDLVLTDMVMPGMDGKAFFDALRRLDPGARVLLMSGYSVAADVDSMMSAGLLGFVQKPFDYNRLGEAVRKALDVEL